MPSLADALEVLLKHSSVPHESTDRAVVEEVIDHLANPVAKSTTSKTKEGDK